MCQPDGGVIDDLLVYCHGETEFLLCVNAANVSKDFDWIRSKAVSYECAIEDRSSDYGLLALQGPRADMILQTLTDENLDQIRYYHFVEGSVAGVPCLISRTGYTGELGFELFCLAAQADSLARAILLAGHDDELVLAGLGARDSLRLEVGFSLYGHEISESISPIQAGLQWTVKFGKPDFVGRSALLAQHKNGTDSRVVFFRTGNRRIVRVDSPVLSGDRRVGRVLSGTLSPVLNEAIGSMLVESDSIEHGLSVEIRGRSQNLILTKPPFIHLKK
jgi:aminomethyltransferase